MRTGRGLHWNGFVMLWIWMLSFRSRPVGQGRVDDRLGGEWITVDVLWVVVGCTAWLTRAVMARYQTSRGVDGAAAGVGTPVEVVVRRDLR
jgi:hypothetical protein